MIRKSTVNLFLLLVAVIGPSLTLHLPRECEVTSELSLDYRGTDINFSVWVPESATEGFLTVQIEFEDCSKPVTYDCATLYRNEVRFKRTRENVPSRENASFPLGISAGWADFTFTMTSFYKLLYHGNNMVLPLNTSLDCKPKLINMKGSNITVNCPADIRAWKVHESSEYVPLDNQEQHSFSFYSTAEFSPVITIEQRDNYLGMDNGSLTTVPSKAKPLPAFQEHHLVISCQDDNRCYCALLVGKEKKKTEDFEVGKKPKSVSIRAKDGSGEFFVLLNGAHRTSLQNEAISTTDATFPVMIAIIVLLTAIIIFLVLFQVKTKLCHGEKDIENTKKTESKFFNAVPKIFNRAGKDVHSNDNQLEETQMRAQSQSLLSLGNASQDSAVCFDEEKMYKKSSKAY